MANSKIDSYISQARSRNLSESVIKENLQKTGWKMSDIETAFNPESSDLPVPAPDYQNSNQGSSSMWDSFQHILLFISLYVMATSIALILHFFVDKYFPGVANNLASSYLDSYNSTLLKGETAALIVSYPIYAFFFLIISKRTLIRPQTRNLKSRKLLIYLTLIATFIIVLVNVISIVFSLLGGNVTINFFLHFLTTISVSGAIFGYYLYQVKEDRRSHA